MPFPVDFYACSRDPSSPACEATKRFFRDLLEAMYLARFINFPRIPIRPEPDPWPGLYFGDPNPQPNINDWRFGLSLELLNSALKQKEISPALDSIRQSGLQYQVAKQLKAQFDFASKELEKELKTLPKGSKASAK